MNIVKISRSYLLVILFLPVFAVGQESHFDALQRMIDDHTVIVQSHVLKNWTLPSDSDARLSSVIKVQATMIGEITDARILRSSGNPDFDRSVVEAVSNSSPLPVTDPEVMDQFRLLQFEFRLGDFNSVQDKPTNRPLDSYSYSNYPRVRSPIYLDK